MIKKLSSIFSYIFHPVFMPFLGMAIILFSGNYLSLITFESKKAILLITVLFTVLLPLSVLPFLKYYKLVSKFTIPERQERLIPLAMSFVFYIFAYTLFKKLGVPSFLQHYLLASTICLGLAVVIHFWWKISLHMIGIGGLMGLISALSFIFNVDIQFMLVLAIAVAGLVGTIRLYLKSHTQTEVYAGFMLGYVLSFSVITFMNS